MSVKRNIAGLAVALFAAPLWAQSSSTSTADVHRLQLDIGYFNLTADTALKYSGGSDGQAGEVNFEKDLGQDNVVDTFWLDSTWRLGRRHQLKLGYTQLSRERKDHTLQRDFVWGGQTYTAGLTADADTSSKILGGYYRFAIVRNDRFEFGPSVGVGHLWMEAGIKATGTVGSQTRTLDHTASASSITGALGGYSDVRPVRNLALHADYLYIKVTLDKQEASVTDWRLAGDYFFTRHIGLGAQYKYNKYRQAVGVGSTELGGEIVFQGFQAFLTFRF